MTTASSPASTPESTPAAASHRAGARTGAPPTRRFAMRGKPLGTWGFTALTVTSLGGPLALAAQLSPGAVSGATSSAGLAMLAGTVVFAAPVVIWLRYSAHVAGPAGLTGFVQAAAGRRLALVQGTLWTVSYLLYLLYTTEAIVYDVLPVVFPRMQSVQPALEMLIPAVLVAVMLAGWRATIVTTAVIAVGQIALAASVAGVSIGGLHAPLTSFGVAAPAGALTVAAAQTSLLYVCGSLPLFMTGEVRTPVSTVRRGLTAGYLVTAAVVIAAVFPLAADASLAGGALPGVDVARRFAGPGFAVAVGVGVAVSSAGVILMEYLALTRLTHAVTSWRLRPITVGIGVLMIVAGPLSLINPAAFYADLLRPSLIALWASQAIVFAVYPRFARAHGRRLFPAVLLSAVALALTLYGLWFAARSTY